MNISEIKKRLATFAAARNWDQFHSPKNLSMGLAAEAAELLEIFQWLTERQSVEIVGNEKEMAHVKEEIADVFIYLVRLADKLNVDIEKAVFEKIDLNEMRYPIELSKGDATKHSKRQRADEVVASKKQKKGGHN
jgi:NTP pyrophosphatase (non-canonical NTP hydrolase)